jgi:hypothetical protein
VAARDWRRHAPAGTDALLVGLLRQSIFGRLAGYEDVNDAERLCHDPAMRWVVGDLAITRSAASASQMGRFETEWLTRPANLAALADLPGQWVDKVHTRRPPRIVVLDMDSSESPTHGDQEGSAYNGHFGCSCYHPLFVFNQLGDLERCALRSGNVHSADGWRAVLEPVVTRYRDIVKRLYFRGDAAFANPEMYEFLGKQAGRATLMRVTISATRAATLIRHSRIVSNWESRQKELRGARPRRVSISQ